MARKLSTIIFFVVLLAETVRATIFWQSDTNRGTSVFAGLNIDPSFGTITVAPDPLGQFGNVYRFFLKDTNSAYGKERTESSGTSTPSGEFRPAYNTEYYIGWRAMWNPMPINGSWVALFQMHGYGVTGQGAPLVLRAVNGDGNVYMQNGANGVDTNFWHVKFQTNVWQTFVIHVLLNTNPAVAYTEIWYNGVLQTNNGGTTRYYGPTWDNVDGVWQDSYNKLKWGVYRSGSLGGKGDATAYMTSAKVGSTYAEVDPNSGGDFSMTTAPPSQIVAPGGGTNYTVTIGALSGFSTNVSLTANGLPSGATASFSPATVTNSGNSTLTITTSNSTPTGSYAISVVGKSPAPAALAHTNTVTLIVSSFTLSATPSSQTVNAGGGTNFTVTVTTNVGFAGTVALGISGLPSGAGANFPTPTLSATGNSTLTVSTTSNTPAGNYPLTISGTNGALVLNATVTLNISGAVANPGTLVWTAGGANTNWSTILNWTNITGGGNGPPGPANNLQFTNTAAGSSLAVNNFVNGNFTVGALQYANNAPNTSPNYHVTQINNGQTLTVTNGLTIGTTTDPGANQVVSAVISGAGGTLVLSNGIFAVTQGSASDGAHLATLDLSGLDTLNASVSRILVGTIPPVGSGQRSAGILFLAKTNVITASSTGVTNGILVGWNDSQGNGSSSGVPNSADKTSALYLGQNNSIYADAIYVGTVKILGALLAFNPNGLSSPSAIFRNRDGVSRVSLWGIGDTSMKNASNQSASGTNDFSGGTIDALVGNLNIGVTQTGNSGGNTGNGTGVLTFDTGAIDVNNLTNGWSVGTGTNATDTGTGTINVNGTATLKVNNNFALAMNTSTGTGVPFGTLNINGGTVQATNIFGGVGISTINLKTGTLDLQPDWAATFGTISNVSTLNIGANGSSNPALLTDAALIATTNTLTIASNGTVSGNTIFITPNLVVNGALSPGNGGAGMMTNSGAVTFGAGGKYVVTIDDATAGTIAGWSLLQSSGGINVQSTAANPFTIAVQTVDNPAANFNPGSNYNWVIATTAAGITNFSANKFTVDASAFANDLAGGNFSVTTNGASLLLIFSPQPPPPVFGSIVADGANYIFSGTGGVTGAYYVVLASTNLAVPLNQWPRIATNVFGAGGAFVLTNTPPPNAAQTFYQLLLP